MDVSGLRCGERRAEVTEISYSDLNLEVSGFSLDFEGKGNPGEEIADLRTQKVQRRNFSEKKGGHSLLDILIVFLAPSLFLLLLYLPTLHLFFLLDKKKGPLFPNASYR